MLSSRLGVLRALLIVVGTAAYAVAEDSYRLKVQIVRFSGSTEQSLTQESVLNSLELIVWPSRPFQVESTHQGDSIRAEGQLSVDDGAFMLDIAYETKRPSSQTSFQTRIALKLDEIQDLGSITTGMESDGKRHVSKDVFRASLARVVVRPIENSQSSSPPVPPPASSGPDQSINRMASETWVRVGPGKELIRVYALERDKNGVLPKALHGLSPQEAGMMIDAIEHKQRFQRLLRDQKTLPTTIERFDLRSPIFEPFSVPKRN